MTRAEMLEAQAGLGSRMAPLREQVLLAIYHGQQEHAWNRETVEHVEGVLERAGLYRRLDRPPGGVLPRPHRVHTADRGRRWSGSATG